MSLEGPVNPNESLIQKCINLKPLGKRANLLRTNLLVPLVGIVEKPSQMPNVPLGHKIVCGLIIKEDEYLYGCNTLEIMQILHNLYEKGGVDLICWYSIEDIALLTYPEIL